MTQDTIALFSRDFAGAPNTVAFTINDLRVVELSDVSGLASAQMDMSTVIQGQVMQFFKLRKTVIFKKGNERSFVQ